MSVDPAAVPQVVCRSCGALYHSTAAARACSDLDEAGTD